MANVTWSSLEQVAEAAVSQPYGINVAGCVHTVGFQLHTAIGSIFLIKVGPVPGNSPLATVTLLRRRG